jgi:hypothetical protein
MTLAIGLIRFRKQPVVIYLLILGADGHQVNCEMRPVPQILPASVDVDVV